MAEQLWIFNFFAWLANWKLYKQTCVFIFYFDFTLF